MSSQGLFLQWEGKRIYRQHIATPRMLEPVVDLSFGDATQNMIVEGDNLQVLASLKSRYGGQVDVCYIDVPYNLGTDDFRYSDKRFHDPDADDTDAVYVNNEDGGKHTKWLNFMAPRLYMLWQILNDDRGVIFISINDVELFRLGMLMNEIFDEKNWLGTIVWKNNTENNPTRIAIEHEYILCYAKNKARLPSKWSGPDSEAKEFMLAAFAKLKEETNSLPDLQKEYRKFVREHKDYVAGLDRFKLVDDKGPYRSGRELHKPDKNGYRYDVPHPDTGLPCRMPTTGWRNPEWRMKELIAEKRIVWPKDHTQVPQIKVYLEDMDTSFRSVIDIYSGQGKSQLKEYFPNTDEFPNPKPVELLEWLLGFVTHKDSLVLDAFGGSGTTGEAVLRLNKRDNGNRRFILIEEGKPRDKFARTLTAPRIKRAIERHDLQGGFGFYSTGRKIDRLAIVGLERDALANLICQADETGRGKGIARLTSSKYVIGTNQRAEAICLVWNGADDSEVTPEHLKSAAKEVNALGLKKPFRIYGTFCRVGDTPSWTFKKIPDEILIQMHILEDQGDDE